MKSSEAPMKTPFNWRQFFIFLTAWTLANSMAWFGAWSIITKGMGISSGRIGTIPFIWLVFLLLALVQWLFSRLFAMTRATPIAIIQNDMPFHILSQASIIAQITIIGLLTTEMGQGEFISMYFLISLPGLIFIEWYFIESYSKKNKNLASGYVLLPILGGFLIVALNTFSSVEISFIHSEFPPFFDLVTQTGILFVIIQGIGMGGLLEGRRKKGAIDSKIEISSEPITKLSRLLYVLIIPIVAYLLLFTESTGLISTAVQPCGWTDEWLNWSPCEGSFEVKGIRNFGISSHGRLLTFFDRQDDSAQVWEFDDNNILFDEELLDDFGWFRDPIFSKDGKYIAVFNRRGDIEIWDTFSGDYYSLQFEINRSAQLEFFEEGNLLAVSDGMSAIIISIPDGELIADIEFVEKSGYAIDIWISPNEQAISILIDEGTVFVWDLSGQSIKNTYQYENPLSLRTVVEYTFDTQGNIVVLLHDDEIFWLHTPEFLIPLVEYSQGIQTKIQFSPNGEVLGIQDEKGLTFWSSNTGEILTEILYCPYMCFIHELLIRDYRITDFGYFVFNSNESTQVWYLPELDTAQN